MSLLALDVGNARTVIGLFDGERLADHWAVRSDLARTSDEWRLIIEGVTDGYDVDALALCCTVPAIQAELREMVERYWSDLPVSIVGPGVKTGVKIHTDNPREVGADRVVNALAASELYGGPAIVVGLNGTATIFDVIDADNAYIGGAIAPAPELSLDALARRGAQLRAVELATPRSVIGKNTVEAVQSGTVYGFAGLVDGIVSRIIVELEARTDEVAVIATGAYSDVVVEHCRTITERDRWLTLHGLRLAHDRNH
jgi:type III pantothenate kinase